MDYEELAVAQLGAVRAGMRRLIVGIAFFLWVTIVVLGIFHIRTATRIDDTTESLRGVRASVAQVAGKVDDANRRLDRIERRIDGLRRQ